MIILLHQSIECHPADDDLHNVDQQFNWIFPCVTDNLFFSLGFQRLINGQTQNWRGRDCVFPLWTQNQIFHSSVTRLNGQVPAAESLSTTIIILVMMMWMGTSNRVYNCHSRFHYNGHCVANSSKTVTISHPWDSFIEGLPLPPLLIAN